MLDSRPKGRGFEPHRGHCIVSLSKNINPSLVLVQPRKTRPFITERLLMGRKESNQTNKQIQFSQNKLFNVNYLVENGIFSELNSNGIVSFFLIHVHLCINTIIVCHYKPMVGSAVAEW